MPRPRSTAAAGPLPRRSGSGRGLPPRLSPTPDAAPEAPPRDGDEAFPDDAVEVGRIVDAWGVKGWIRVQPHSSDPRALFSSKRWFLRPPERPGPDARTAPLPTLLRITEARSQGDEVVAGVRDIADRDAAEALRGARVHVARSSFPSTTDDEYYWVDLIGLQVVNRAGEALGEVVGLIDTGVHSVLRVAAGPRAGERLIPFVSAYVDSVDRESRRIVVDWSLDY